MSTEFAFPAAIVAIGVLFYFAVPRFAAGHHLDGLWTELLRMREVLVKALAEMERLTAEIAVLTTERAELEAENRRLIHHLKLAEKAGVEAGLFDLEDCAWYRGMPSEVDDPQPPEAA